MSRVVILLLMMMLLIAAKSLDDSDTELQQYFNEEIDETEYDDLSKRPYRKWDHSNKCPYNHFFTCIEGYWHRKQLLPIQDIEIAGFVFIFILIVWGNIAGISGGYLTTIVIYELYGFEFRKSLGYTATLNCVASLVRFIFHYHSKHPSKPHHTIIDYEIVIICLPLSILGYLIGDAIFGVLPMFVVAVCLGVFWLGVSIEMFIKGVKMHKEESKFRKIQHNVEQKSKIKENKKYVNLDNEEFIDDMNLKKPKLKELNNEMKQSSINAAESIISKSKRSDWGSGHEDDSTNIACNELKYSRSMNTMTSCNSKLNRYTGAVPLSITQMKFLEQSDSDTDSEIERELLLKASNKLSKTTSSPNNSKKQLKQMKILMKYIERKIKKKTEKMQQDIKKIFADESSHFVNKKFVFVILSASVIILNIFFRGQTQTSAFGIKQCSIGDWISLFVLGTFAFIISMLAMTMVRNLYQSKRHSGYMFDVRDVHWTSSETIKFLTMSSLLGLLAGLIGNGDGTVFIPFFIEIGMHPIVSWETGVYISIIFSASLATTYIIEGYFDDTYIFVFIAITVVATLLGLLIANLIYKTFKRSSLILFFLGINFLIVAITLPHQTLHRIFKNDFNSRYNIWEAGKYWMNNSST